MRTIVHLSDLHFGRVDQSLLTPLVRRIHQLEADLIVVSGDLSQRARSAQFQEARQFLDRLPSPQIVVPGNHDVPLYNIFQRFFQPLDKYRRYIAADLEPTYVDEEIAVIGINTARSLTFKGGRINEEQAERVHEQLSRVSENVTKIIVTHHPFDLPADWNQRDIVGRADMAMQMFARCGADILLAGHLHVTNAVETTARYKLGGYSALVVQAGTATSTRHRGESNSFNVLRITSADIHIDHHTWQAELEDFAISKTEAFKQTVDGWVNG